MRCDVSNLQQSPAKAHTVPVVQQFSQALLGLEDITLQVLAFLEYVEMREGEGRPHKPFCDTIGTFINIRVQQGQGLWDLPQRGG